MENEIFNKLMLGAGIVDGLKDIDKETILAAEEMAKEILVSHIPSIDATTQENVDLVIRPLALTILANELLLDNIFSETTLVGITKSKKIPYNIKTRMLEMFAKENKMEIKRGTPDDMYSQISFNLENSSSILSDKLEAISLDKDNGVESLLVLDSRDEELTRNKLAYIELNSSMAMTFSRSNLEMGTLMDGGYSRSDRARFDDWKKSSRIVLPGMIDVLFTTSIIEETIQVDKVNGSYTLPEGFYISVESKTKNYLLASSDKMVDGIVKLSPELWMEDGGETEEIHVTRYKDINTDTVLNSKKIETLDVLFRGKFPLILNLKLYTKEPCSVDEIRPILDGYLVSIGRNMEEISPSDITSILRRKGIHVVVSSRNTGFLFASVEREIAQSITFPLTKKDLFFSDSVNSSAFTGKTIAVFLGDITVEVE